MENLYKSISDTSLNEYPDIVEDAQIHHTPSGAPAKLRIHIVDGSYLDIWFSVSGKYSYTGNARTSQDRYTDTTTPRTRHGDT